MTPPKQVTTPTERLTDAALLAMLHAAADKAQAMGKPQCIVIVDPSAVDLAVLRMTEARVLSLRPAIAAATDGTMTGLPGGLPIWRGGVLLGGIGVGSGTGAEDVQVAEAALAAISTSASLQAENTICAFIAWLRSFAS